MPPSPMNDSRFSIFSFVLNKNLWKEEIKYTCLAQDVMKEAYFLDISLCCWIQRWEQGKYMFIPSDVQANS